MDNVAIATQITASLFGFNNTCPDDPYGGSSGVGITIPGWGNGVWGTQIVFDYNGRAPFFRTFFSFGQSVGDWIKLVTATPPQRYDLPLNDGFSANGTCKYFKIQENIVNLSGGVSGSFPSNQDTQIGILPEGFRPSGNCRRGAVTNASTAYIEIRVDGSVWIHPFNSTGAYAFFDADFIAIS